MGRTSPQPLCAVYTPACLASIQLALEADDMRMMKFLERLPVYEQISLEDVATLGDPDRLFFNVNTIGDLVTADRLATLG
jgi:molybdopterin-guanine dinucleotide biosynthesis protein A